MIQIGPESAVQSLGYDLTVANSDDVGSGISRYSTERMHRSLSCSINDLWTDLVIEPLTGNSHDKFSIDAFAADGLAHPTTFGSLLQWVRKAKY
ncbi:MAG: hypothetical protein WAN75_04385 [Xanthobacteraceae bacterium]|jgi:hypothetical protein